MAWLAFLLESTDQGNHRATPSLLREMQIHFLRVWPPGWGRVKAELEIHISQCYSPYPSTWALQWILKEKRVPSLQLDLPTGWGSVREWSEAQEGESTVSLSLGQGPHHLVKSWIPEGREQQGPAEGSLGTKVHSYADPSGFDWWIPSHPQHVPPLGVTTSQGIQSLGLQLDPPSLTPDPSWGPGPSKSFGECLLNTLCKWRQWLT